MRISTRNLSHTPFRPIIRLLVSASVAAMLTSCSFLHDNTIGLLNNGGAAEKNDGAPGPATQESAAPVVPSDTNKSPSAEQTGRVSPQKDPTLPTSQRVSIEKLQQRKRVSPPSTIEIVWKVPTEIVDGFVVRYGFAKDQLISERRVRLTEIQRLEDPQNGPVYRYLLPGIPKNRSVYVSIAAFRGETISEASPVFEVQAEE